MPKEPKNSTVDWENPRVNLENSRVNSGNSRVDSGNSRVNLAVRVDNLKDVEVERLTIDGAWEGRALSRP